MDLTQYLPQLLLVAGAGLQWARADKRFDDRIYAVCAVALAICAHLLVADYGQSARLLVVTTISSLPDSLIPILGGTGAASVLANIAAKSGADPQSPVIPVTNSK